MKPFSSRTKVAAFLPALAVALAAVSPIQAAPQKVAATVNSDAIMTADVERMVSAVQTLNPALKGNTPEAKKLMDATRSRILDNLIEQALLYQKAKELKVQVSDERIATELKNIKSDYRSEAEYNKWLSEVGKTTADLRAVVVKDLSIEELFKKTTASVTVSDAEIKDFYQKNIKLFTRPETASVRQIWIAARKEVPAADRAKAKARATTLAQQARGATDFGKLAFDNSDDPVSKERGGDLGIVARTTLMAKPLIDAIFNTPAGGVAGPIETDSGYHIIKVDSRLPAVTMKFEEVKEAIRPRLLRDKTSDFFQKQVEVWKKAAKIKKNI